MSLDPLATAPSYLREIARSLEREHLSDIVFEIDRLAQKLAAIHQSREAQNAARVAQAVREIEEYEATSRRAFDAAVARMPTQQLEQLMGAV